MSSLYRERHYGYGGCEGQMDDVQVENLIVEVEGKLESARDNAKTADSCDRFKRAPENQSDSLAVHSHPGDKINHKDGETIPVEDLGRVDDSGHEKIVEDQVQEEPHTACCVGEEYVVDILVNLSKGNIPDSEKLNEESSHCSKNFTFASEKRRRLHWTAEEEEMLKVWIRGHCYCLLSIQIAVLLFSNNVLQF
ncbi:hypothetical protein WN944_004189 [Citrus x changshan-huyou]|uniref:Uncharacterized protein n=1 Tax=Citrus x changshan-huyou TaxID=2935761 RepID=A0AAP0M2R9_9ROSI